ncbi:class E sortase [Marmoricola sp. OAE513]|uniref:class E sortase n=1 Tax=Marmoricola sp. OAE513 TaxID=2817894 RepID=UPI001D343B07
MSDHEEPGSAPLTPPTLNDADAPPLVDNSVAPRTPAPAAKRRATGPKEKSTGRRITFWIGIGLILAGLGLLGYVAWQLWGTNWISHREQKKLTKQTIQDWNVQEGCDKFCPHGKVSALIRIPKFGKDYVIPVLEGTSPDILAKGFGHFEDTAQPDLKKSGNYALAGHRVTHGEPLRDMPDLRPGDKVIVETKLHTYVYRLDTNPNDLVISFHGTWVLDLFPKNPDGGVGPVLKPDAPDPDCKPSDTVHCDIKDMYKKILTLTTCSEIFHTDNRMIAFGHLIEVRDKQIVTKTPTPAAG